jgi:NADH:ubiquinone oxidoreductase subunit 6 (subunit J)
MSVEAATPCGSTVLLAGRPPLVLPLGALGLLALMVANAALAVAAPHPLWSLAALGLFLCGVARLFALAPAATLMLLPFVVVQGSVMVSLPAIEGGAFMKEMGQAGEPSPAGAAYVLCSALFLSTAAFVCSRLRERQPQPWQAVSPVAGGQRLLLCVAVLGGATAVVAWLLATGLRAGFPLLTGTDRFAFRAASADVLTLNFLILKYVLAAALGTSAVWAPGAAWRRAHHAAFMAYVVVSFLFGDKFFIILMAACFYAMPFLVARRVDIAAHVRRSLPLALLVFGCASAVTFFIYSGHGELGLDRTLQRLGDRVAGQGQLWYLAVRDASALLRLDTPAIGLNLANLVARPPADFTFEHRLAPFYFVERYSPTALYDSFLHNGGMVTPTMVFEAYSLVMVGYAGLVVALLAAGAWTGWLAHHLARTMASGNPVNVLLPAFAMMQTVVLMTQGTLHSLLSLSAFKAYAAFFVLQRLVAAWLKHCGTAPGAARATPNPQERA